MSSGKATASTAALAAGTHVITATYSGDASYAESSGRVTPDQVVNQAATTTSLASSATSVAVLASGPRRPHSQRPPRPTSINKEPSTCSSPSARRQSHHTRSELKRQEIRQILAFLWGNFSLAVLQGHPHHRPARPPPDALAKKPRTPSRFRSFGIDKTNPSRSGS